ncbi:hypothetical protein VTN77DRAFT_3994 [Rasamsonia byssochlamydoides]|uniref:uncharacterized protein n=1 Tax=Rasamsonia byssochlamydoides TaxID=89139 RepID=UPI00374298C1
MASSPQQERGNRSTNAAALSPISTDGQAKRSGLRASSNAKDRLSTYSTVSLASQNWSRPPSAVFPAYPSSLPYALVRDFAYPAIHPLHYGPPPPTSGVSTPASENRRLSDPQPASWDGSKGEWSAGSWSSDSAHGHQHLPAMSFGDGPPYSEDEDLHSPIVTSRHRKHKSAHTLGDGRRGRSPGDSRRGYSNESDRGTLVNLNGDGSETYYVKDDVSTDDGPGGEFVTYPTSEGTYGTGDYSSYDNESYGYDRDFDSDDDISDTDPSRYSRDYQFSIASPDEEMHGKAVALFDFTREHENELPLKEGQVILVSYRHGQGWLVAEDPKTGESGLVPEEYVRLVRDIEGGLNSLNGELNNGAVDSSTYLSPTSMDSEQAATPAETEHSTLSSDSLSTASGNRTHEKHPSVISTFSTSSRDLEPYPSHLLGDSQGKANPPQVDHDDEKKDENDNHTDTPSSET